MLLLPSAAFLHASTQQTWRDYQHALVWSCAVGFLTLALISVLSLVVLRSIIRPLSIVMTDLAESSIEIGQASGQLSTSSRSLAREASRQAAALEQTHATLEEMSSGVQQNSQTVDGPLMTRTLSDIRVATFLSVDAFVPRISRASFVARPDPADSAFQFLARSHDSYIYVRSPRPDSHDCAFPIDRS